MGTNRVTKSQIRKMVRYRKRSTHQRERALHRLSKLLKKTVAGGKEDGYRLPESLH